MEKGFLEGLLSSFLDFSFTEFVTTRLIKLLYILGIVGAGILALSFIVTGFSSSFGMGVLSLVLSPIVFALFVLYVRICLELIIVLFRIAENTSELVRLQKPEAPGPSEEFK